MIAGAVVSLSADESRAGRLSPESDWDASSDLGYVFPCQPHLEVIRMEPTSGLEPLTCRLRIAWSEAAQRDFKGLGSRPTLQNDVTLRH
jgi:hypothetical protein